MLCSFILNYHFKAMSASLSPAADRSKTWSRSVESANDLLIAILMQNVHARITNRRTLILSTLGSVVIGRALQKRRDTDGAFLPGLWKHP